MQIQQVPSEPKILVLLNLKTSWHPKKLINYSQHNVAKWWHMLGLPANTLAHPGNRLTGDTL